MEDPVNYLWTLMLMPIASVLGFAVSFGVRGSLPPISKNALTDGFDPKIMVRNWNSLRERPGLIPTVIGLTLFWSMSILFALQYDSFWLQRPWLQGRSHPEQLATGGNQRWSWLGKLVLGPTFPSIAEPRLGPAWEFCMVCGIRGVVFRHEFGSTMIWLAIAGMGAGMFVVPLNTFLEQFTPRETRASCIGTSNIVTVIGMLMACGLNFMLGSVMGINPGWIFLVAGAVLALATLLAIRWAPDHFVRLGTYLLTRIFYKIEVVGEENVPKTGGALLVFNHVSFADGNLITASFSRFVRFVVYQGHYEFAILKRLGEVMQAIPVDPEAPPKEIVQQLRKASDALNRGELVCIFAEGSITRTGFTLPFLRGFELIMKRAPGVPIIPGYIDGMWGSVFSFYRGKFFWKRPKKWRLPVTVCLGKPLPADSPATQVREEVQLLGVECFERRKSRRLPYHRQFLRTAKKFSRRQAIGDATTGVMTFGQTLMRSAILARMLSRKLGKENVVGVFVPPSIGGALANVSLTLLGKIPVNLNYTTGVDVLNNCIKQANITQVVTSRLFLKKVGLHPSAELIYLEDLRNDLRTSDKIFGLLARFLPAWITERTLFHLGSHGMDDLATIIFSSGSTGDPKGVMLTHNNICSNTEGIMQMVNASEEDRLMGVLPLFHSFGFTVTLWLPLTHGPFVMFHFNPLEADIIGNLIRDHKLTIFVSTATFLRNHIRKCGPDDFKSIRLIVCGAEKLPMNVADQFEQKFGVRPMEGYGCTELSPAVSANVPDFIEGSYRQIGQKRGSIGHSMPGMAVRVVDPDTWEPLPIGTEGMLIVKGPNVMKGYLNKPELTKQVIRDGWYQTGDIAKLDEDGFITITDRLSRFSKIGGEMVPHGKIEDLLHEILETNEQICAVVGVPDPRKGERLIVIHTPLPMSVDQLWEKLRDKGLPPIWLPAKTAFYEVQELPVLGTGKSDLKGIKRLALDKVGNPMGLAGQTS
ncbi:MAG: AMP-binding protein [Planctomycetota bacterium]